jgi:ketosteroid isomerase-like protein
MANNSILTLQGLYADFSQGNISKILSLIDLQVVIHNPESLPYGGVHQGRDGFIALMMNLFTTWSGIQVKPEHYMTTGDSIVAQGEIIYQASMFNDPLKTTFVHVWKMPNAFITEIWFYEWDTAQLLAYLAKTKS